MMTASTELTTSTIEFSPIESKILNNEHNAEGATTGQQKATTLLTMGSTNISNSKCVIHL